MSIIDSREICGRCGNHKGCFIVGTDNDKLCCPRCGYMGPRTRPYMKPCPVCGSENTANVFNDAFENYATTCLDCGFRTQWMEHVHASLDAWNFRSTSVNLLPCPLCGGAVSIYSRNVGKFVVRCYACGAEVNHAGSRFDVAELWNRRSMR